MWGIGHSLEARIKSAFALIQIGQLWCSTESIWGITCGSRRLAFRLLYSDTWTVSELSSNNMNRGWLMVFHGLTGPCCLLISPCLCSISIFCIHLTLERRSFSLSPLTSLHLTLVHWVTLFLPLSLPLERIVWREQYYFHPNYSYWSTWAVSQSSLSVYH